MMPSRLGWASLATLTSLVFVRSVAGCVGDAPVTPPTVDAGADVAPVEAGGGDASDAALPEVPTTCNEAAAAQGYIGCDFWPTVLPNAVFVEFDFAVVVANPGSAPANISVTGPGLASAKQATVPPNQVAKIYLPWDATLKGPEGNRTNGVAPPLPTTSVRKADGAFHLVSSVPIAAYQFNPLEYQGTGGPTGKDWSTCPALSGTCLSYTNDASLLLPSTSWQKHVRIIGPRSDSNFATGSFTGIVASQPTSITLKTSASASVNAGAQIAATGPNATLTFSMSAGETVILNVPGTSDLSGSLVVADKPVEVFTGAPCQPQPLTSGGSCDHLEEMVPPAQALGKSHVVVPPQPAPGGTPGHVIRFVGNANGTVLSYNPAKPTGCPASLNAGDVAECGPVPDPFVVTGDHEFAVVSLMLRGSSATSFVGDPSLSIVIPTEQYRSKYVFMAPDDFSPSFADIVAAAGTTMTLDGSPVGGLSQIGTSGFFVAHVPLSASGTGGHLLVSDKPVGVQVLGYGSGASYQYPGGANVRTIAPVPQ